MNTSVRHQSSRLCTRLADRGTRAWTQGIILLAGAAVFLAVLLIWNGWTDVPKSADKALHFHAGQVIAGISFYLTYLSIIARVLLIEKGRDSITIIIFWLPTMIAGAAIVAFVVVFISATGKEAFDFIGLGSVEWMDVEITLEGAFSMTYPVAFIMALTPVFVPLDLIMQMPKLFISDMRFGIKTLDAYVKEQNTHLAMDKPAEVMVVEDDIVCATTVMNFCCKVGLKCHHVSTASEANRYLMNNMHNIKLIILDNFLRVDNAGKNTTGSEWLQNISNIYPLKKRPFLVVIISGYTDLLGSSACQADLVLQKPWDPFRLIDFLESRDVLRKQRK